MIRFSDDHSWDDLLPRLREAISRGAFRDLAEAQRAFDLAPDEPLDGLAGGWTSDFDVVSLTEIDGEIVSEAVDIFASAPRSAGPFAATGSPFSGTSVSGLPRARTLRTELLERRDALSAMPVVSYAATATAWQATVFQAFVWQSSVAGQAPAALVSTAEDCGQSYDRSAGRPSLRVVGNRVVGSRVVGSRVVGSRVVGSRVVGSRVVGRRAARRAASAVHDYALAELLADRAVTCPSDCLEYAVA